MTDKIQTSDLILIEQKQESLEKRSEHYFQIDFLKAVMIFLVIFDHIVHWGLKSEIGVALWERICIPVFLVIMGFNMGLSFKRHGANTLGELYSWRYFKSKILRYIVPFLILYAFSTLIGLILYQFNFIAMYDGQYYPQHGIINLFTGILPFWGPGNWFIPVILGSILIIPFIYWAFLQKPVFSLILCFILEIMMQLIVFFHIGEITTWEEAHLTSVFMNSVLFYLSAIGLGIWFSFDHKLYSNRNLFIWILFVLSLRYLFFYQFSGLRFRIGDIPLIRGDYNFLVFPYSAFLVLVLLKILPQRINPNIPIIKSISRAISQISKATYHILLTQILGYGIIYALLGTHYIINPGSTPLDVLYLICAEILFISFGILWYKIDQNRNILRRVLYYFNLFLILPIIVFMIYNSMRLLNIVDAILPIKIVIAYVVAFLVVNITVGISLHHNKDQDSNSFRRNLYLINILLLSSLIVFITYVAVILSDWIPLSFLLILIYAGIALIVNFGMRFVVKKPLKLLTLALWTSFLLYIFIITLLYLAILPPTEFLIQNISIVAFLIFVIIGTVLNYTYGK